MTENDMQYISEVMKRAKELMVKDAVTGIMIRTEGPIMRVMIEKHSALLGDKNPAVSIDVSRVELNKASQADARLAGSQHLLQLHDKLEQEYTRRIRDVNNTKPPIRLMKDVDK